MVEHSDAADFEAFFALGSLAQLILRDRQGVDMFAHNLLKREITDSSILKYRRHRIDTILAHFNDARHGLDRATRGITDLRLLAALNLNLGLAFPWTPQVYFGSGLNR